MKQWLNRCHFGDVRDVLHRMIADGVKVNTIITSPPYWGLRSYLPEDHPEKGYELGHEPTLREFIANMTEVFSLAREVLTDDGTAWVNMGDCYITSGGPVNTAPGAGQKTGARAPGIEQANRTAQPGLKPKDMAGQPWRLAIALQDDGWWLRSDIIWNKPNPMPESVRDRPTKAHEYLFLLAKQESYYFNFEGWKEPVSGGAHARRAAPRGVGFGHGTDAEERNRGRVKPSGWDSGEGRAHTQLIGRYSESRKALPEGQAKVGAFRDRQRKLAAAGSGVKSNTSMDEAIKDLVDTRNRRTVWTIPIEAYHGAHFATFPQKLVEPCVLAACPAGGTVLDIFFGSGTVGQVAQRLGCNWIGIDLNRANEPLQRDRIGSQPGLVLEVAHA